MRERDKLGQKCRESHHGIGLVKSHDRSFLADVVNGESLLHHVAFAAVLELHVRRPDQDLVDTCTFFERYFIGEIDGEYALLQLMQRVSHVPFLHDARSLRFHLRN